LPWQFAADRDHQTDQRIEVSARDRTKHRDEHHEDLDLVLAMNAGLYQSPVQALVALKALNQYVLKAAHRHSL
jgi:hypothetical protein